MKFACYQSGKAIAYHVLAHANFLTSRRLKFTPLILSKGHLNLLVAVTFKIRISACISTLIVFAKITVTSLSYSVSDESSFY
jgi:hypothetical protein